MKNKISSQLFLSPICICALACILMACKFPVVPYDGVQNSNLQSQITPSNNTFSAHAGDSYTINYPTTWQFNTNTTNAGDYEGDYFTDPTNAYAFHVYSSQDQTDPATILNHLLTSIPGSQILASAPTIALNGIVWQQGKAIRTDQETGKPMEIMGWVARNPLATQHIPYFVLHADGAPASFDSYTKADFLPMLQTFHFTS